MLKYFSHDTTSLQCLRDVKFAPIVSIGVLHAGGCGKLNPVDRYVVDEPPGVFTLQLAWERKDESAASIAATLDTISEIIDLSEFNLPAPQITDK